MIEISDARALIANKIFDAIKASGTGISFDALLKDLNLKQFQVGMGLTRLLDDGRIVEEKKLIEKGTYDKPAKIDVKYKVAV